MSAPELAAVAEVLGTLSVRVGASRTKSSGTPSAVAATWIILVCRPWPISTPPWLISTEPSLYTCTRAPAWLNAVRLNEMPNFTGVIASARLRVGVGGVELGDPRLPGRDVGLGRQGVPDRFQPFGVPHRLTVRGGLPGRVEVPAPQLLRRRRPAAARSGPGCPR